MVLWFARALKRLLPKILHSLQLKSSLRPQATKSARLETIWLLLLHLLPKTQPRNPMVEHTLFATPASSIIFLVDHAASVITVNGMDTTPMPVKPLLPKTTKTTKTTLPETTLLPTNKTTGLLVVNATSVAALITTSTTALIVTRTKTKTETKTKTRTATRTKRLA